MFFSFSFDFIHSQVYSATTSPRLPLFASSPVHGELSAAVQIHLTYSVTNDVSRRGFDRLAPIVKPKSRTKTEDRFSYSPKK